AHPDRPHRLDRLACPGRRRGVGAVLAAGALEQLLDLVVRVVEMAGLGGGDGQLAAQLDGLGAERLTVLEQGPQTTGGLMRSLVPGTRRDSCAGCGVTASYAARATADARRSARSRTWRSIPSSLVCACCSRSTGPRCSARRHAT